MASSLVSRTEAPASLNSFRLDERQAALQALLAQDVVAPAPDAIANMHCHTFFSYNAYGMSPSALAWMARTNQIGLLGIVDFDVLDAVDEFLDAADAAGIRGSAGIEVRTFLPEFATREMNSPGEPGVLYHMAIGFTTSRVSPAAQTILNELRTQSAERNRAMIDRLNRYLATVQVDYDADVLPLTPGGNATERHMVVAYIQAAAAQVNDPAAFWAAAFGMGKEAVEKAMGDSPGFQNLLRNKLMKQGGPGYVKPGYGTFPPVDKINELALACRAIPCAAWLDGLSTGEQAMEELLALLVGKGAAALNIVPDRNWNLANPEQKALKLGKLYEVCAQAAAFDLPLNIGTELNSYGQKLVDTFDTPELAPVRQAFVDGAYFIYGHTVLERRKQLGFQSEWAQNHLPSRKERNAFFTEAGKRIAPGATGAQQLASVTEDYSPGDLLKALK
jgi:hypothetical protein